MRVQVVEGEEGLRHKGADKGLWKRAKLAHCVRQGKTLDEVGQQIVGAAICVKDRFDVADDVRVGGQISVYARLCARVSNALGTAKW